jgi:ketosteroid isomerase-like protein
MDADARQALAQAFEDRDLDQVIALLDPHVVWRGLQQPGEATPICHSRAEVRAVFERALAGGQSGSPEIVAESDDGIVIDPHPEPPGRGMEELHHIYRFRDGRIVTMEDYIDRQHALDALGRDEN